MRLLFVCTGNICRSAAADRLMSTWAARKRGLVEVRSAGTMARDGSPMHPWTADALERLHVPAGGFAAHRLEPEHVDWADLVLTMATEHREQVVGVNPRGMLKVFTLRETTRLARALHLGELPAGSSLAAVLAQGRAAHRRGGDADDIADPIQESAAFHDRTVRQIADELQVLVDVLEAQIDPAPEPLVRMRRLPPVPPPVSSASRAAHRG